MSCNHENCRLRPDDMLGKCTCGDCGEKVDIDDAINAKLAKVDRFLEEVELRAAIALNPPKPFTIPDSVKKAWAAQGVVNVNPLRETTYGPSALTPPDETVEVKKGTFEWALAMMKQGKKVRRQVQTMDGYMYFNHGAYFMSGARLVVNIHIDNLVATDWQIVEEAHP